MNLDFILYYFPECPYCQEFKREILPKLKNTNWGGMKVNFVEQNTHDPEIQSYLESKSEANPRLTNRDRLRLKTVPHLAIKQNGNLYIWTGKNRTYKNIVMWIQGEMAHSMKV